MRSVLFIQRKPPHSTLATRESIDAALANAAFGVTTAMLFIDDGVFQILKQQNAGAAQLKPTAPMFESLDMYGVEERYVCQASLDARNLSIANLLIPVQPLDASAIRQLLARFDHLLTF